MRGHVAKLCTQLVNTVYPMSQHVINDTRPFPLFLSLALLRNTHGAERPGNEATSSPFYQPGTHKA